MFDLVFISYNEPNAEENWLKLKSRIPFAKRVNGVKGIHQAHIKAASKVFTTMFWVVDGDSQVLDTFDFQEPAELWEERVYVYRAMNPVNGLVYGYGGIKLLPTVKTINMKLGNVDMTTSISEHFEPVPIVASITKFDTDPFNTWKSAFRECVKLSSKTIERGRDDETTARLDTWCTVASGEFANYAISGAITGREFGSAHQQDVESLKKINDFDWLKEHFNKST
jgi:hypothetical protein